MNLKGYGLEEEMNFPRSISFIWKSLIIPLRLRCDLVAELFDLIFIGCVVPGSDLYQIIRSCDTMYRVHNRIRLKDGGVMNILSAYIITFIASFCILVIEIVAGRILAPFVGVSLYTWTSVIGVVLAGISVGAFLGGKLADRFPEKKTLGWLLLLSGIATLSISPVTNIVAGYSFPTSLMVQILIVTALTFFIPSCILGMISPVVVKLVIRSVERVGDIVGKIYAVSTFGSILGTFAAGFFLISWMGTRQILLLMGTILILTSLAWG